MALARCYSSLAIYANEDLSARLETILEVIPSLCRGKDGEYSWIYSTKEAEECVTVEDHLRELQSTFEPKTQHLMSLLEGGCTFRVWIFFALTEINQAFVINERFVGWISQFKADIYLDIWNDQAVDGDA